MLPSSGARSSVVMTLDFPIPISNARNLSGWRPLFKFTAGSQVEPRVAGDNMVFAIPNLGLGVVASCCDDFEVGVGGSLGSRTAENWLGVWYLVLWGTY